MRGDRFKRRLPKFIGQISDLDDTFYAEDKEFELIDRLIDDFEHSQSVSGIAKSANPDYFLRKLELDYGLDHKGTTKERIARILLKMRAKRTTTEEVILDICKTFGLPARYTPQYEEYAFLLDLVLGEDGADLDKLNKAMREVAPAHLEDRVNIHFGRDLVLKSQHGLDSYLLWLCGENLCGDIPYIRSVGKAYETALSIKAGSYDSKNYYGMPGKNFRSADLYGYDPTEIRYIQDVGSIKTYDFGGKND